MKHTIKIDTSRKLYRDDIADATISKFKAYATEYGFEFKLCKADKKGEYVQLTGLESDLNIILIKEFGKDVDGNYADTNPFVTGLKELMNIQSGKRFSDYEDEVLELMKKSNIKIVDVDTKINWHMHSKSMLLPNGQEVNFNVGLENAMRIIVASFV